MHDFQKLFSVPDLMADCKFDEEMSMLVDALVHDEEVSNPLKAGIEEALRFS